MKYSRILLIALMLTALAACSDEDPCDETVCYNSAPCVDGTCQCPEGYTGIDCSQEKTPTSVRLTKVIVTKFPAFNGTSNWDAGPGGVEPDIFFEIVKDGSVAYSTAKPFKENASAIDDYPHDLTPVLALTPTQTYTINLYDHDGVAGSGVGEFMGGVGFLPYQSGQGFQEVVEVKNNDVGFELHYEFIF